MIRLHAGTGAPGGRPRSPASAARDRLRPLDVDFAGFGSRQRLSGEAGPPHVRRDGAARPPCPEASALGVDMAAEVRPLMRASIAPSWEPLPRRPACARVGASHAPAQAPAQAPAAALLRRRRRSKSATRRRTSTRVLAPSARDPAQVRAQAGQAVRLQGPSRTSSSRFFPAAFSPAAPTR